MSFKKVLLGLLIAGSIIAILVIFFTSSSAVDTAQQGAEGIKNIVENSTIIDTTKEKGLNIWGRLFN